ACSARPRRGASMGPSTNIHGEGRWLDRAGSDSDASMGPSTNIDGEIMRHDGFVLSRLASMGPSTNIDGEPGLSMASGSPAHTLQWGRRRTSTERPDVGSWFGLAHSFNGAVDEHRRRGVEQAQDGGPLGTASMGPTS